MRNVEIKRKLAHLLFGTIVASLLLLGFIESIHIFFSVVIVVILSFLSKKYRIPVMYGISQNLERDENLKSFPAKGLVFYLIGIFLVLSFFPLDIAIAAILVLAFADSIGHLFGIRFGKIKHPYVSKKFIEGWAAGLIAGFLAAFVFVPWYEALAASFFAMLVEGIELKVGAEEVDDNLIIPLVAASAIWAVRAFL